jgi:light-regulated signal transduction histidine kinase (bacteriophytochrome)
MIIMLIGMTLYESLKQAAIPNITIWESHLITIIFSSILATIASYFVILNRQKLLDQLSKEISDRKQTHEELIEANTSLEAFNYTISHDLKLPLTVMNGYCQIMQEMCGSRLNEQCQQYLREISSGTLRMNELINALLKFSTVARSELSREPVDLSEIANTVAAELALTEPARRVVFRISEGITANADANLLRVVMENILGNAWKYTGAREEAVIEFGVIDIDGKAACFVRDNGTGFDMAHVNNIFMPFNRLPGNNIVKGHGIGLATVDRIIKRHGGKLWAEGELGKGATFYFTL